MNDLQNCKTKSFNNTPMTNNLFSPSGNEAKSLEKMSQSEKLHEKDANDSLTRMNQSLEKLIQEAETSLNTHLTLDSNSYSLKRSNSCPRFTTTILPQTRRKSVVSVSSMQQELFEKQGQIQLQQQQRRYLHSQWKLAMAMKQLVQTVQNIIETNSNVQVVHHHHYHHVYHHYENSSTITEEIIITESEHDLSMPPIKKVASLTSLVKQAFYSAVYQSSKSTEMATTLSESAKLRTMFLATLIFSQKFNVKPIWIQRGHLLLSRWKKRSKAQCNLWTNRSRLLHFICLFI
ncbi:hypothetical protein HPULCUR_002515 [Helicostylum pulchrum]|uniref:Uncharacterized protein n=1 Tax=Helicostylum pulchrum TaxID=562976 RepID=A0ABP9XQQ0_9FUNG